MYATCLFCSGSLGTNEAIEHFPVGRRLAFDSATGRLWVVCRRCERWNLSPIETRWEAIEEAERAFRGTRMRSATDNIGLARLAEGTELVRIGAPLKSEFAAWRYGDQFGKRRRKSMLWLGAAAVGSAAPLLGMVAGLSLVGSGVSIAWSSTSMFSNWYNRRVPMLTVRDEQGRLLRLTNANVQGARLSPTEDQQDWRLVLPHVEVLRNTGRLSRMIGHGERASKTTVTETLSGAAAHRALATMLPHLNRGGSGARGVRNALEVINASPSLDHLLRAASKDSRTNWQYITRTATASHLVALPSRIRLALEMTLHEDDERRAMEGELRELEARWREADEIAKIADALLLPPEIEERVDELRDRAR